MFTIESHDGVVAVAGRLDATQASRAQEFLDRIDASATIDMAGLEYISSAGLRVLLFRHKRLMGQGKELRLVNVSAHINDVFTLAGFDQLFQIERALCS